MLVRHLRAPGTVHIAALWIVASNIGPIAASAAGWHSNGRLSVEATLSRTEETVQPGNCTQAHLVLGTTHNDELLMHEGLALEQFPSPYTWRCTCDLTNAKGELQPHVVICLHQDVSIISKAFAVHVYESCCMLEAKCATCLSASMSTCKQILNHIWL